MEELWNDYFDYLIWRGHLEKFQEEYEELFKILHNIEFTWIIDRDDNRESDGMDLRSGYTPSSGIYNRCDIVDEEAFYAHWCSVFEMLLGLSIRVDNEYIGDPREEHPEFFFMEMIKNLNFSKMITNPGRWNENSVKMIVKRWMNRQFSRDGRGSPFPIKHDHRDQRKIEIWDQMISYINERYFGG